MEKTDEDKLLETIYLAVFLANLTLATMVLAGWVVYKLVIVERRTTRKHSSADIESREHKREWPGLRRRSARDEGAGAFTLPRSQASAPPGPPIPDPTLQKQP